MPNDTQKTTMREHGLRNLKARVAYLEAHPNKVPPQILREAQALLKTREVKQ